MRFTEVLIRVIHEKSLTLDSNLELAGGWTSNPAPWSGLEGTTLTTSRDTERRSAGCSSANRACSEAGCSKS